MKKPFVSNTWGMIFRIVCLAALLATSIPFQSTAKAASAENPIMLGVYITDWLDQTILDNNVIAMDTWAGKRSTMVGIMLDMSDPIYQNTIDTHLGILWDNGYTPFINLTFGNYNSPSAADIAAGIYDTDIQEWANAYANWAVEGKQSFIALLPSMNNAWISYGGDPDNYRLAYRHIRDIFTQAGVTSEDAVWVFAPYGKGEFSFTEYYPGSDVVDILGVSIYHYGFCLNDTYGKWETPEEALNDPISQLRALAPDKSVFVTRLATSAQSSKKGQYSFEDKNAWLQATYTHLTNVLGVRAVLYYNENVDCDWPIYSQNGTQYSGYPQAISSSTFAYIEPMEVAALDFKIELKHIYLPLSNRNYKNYTSKMPILLGLYSSKWYGIEENIDNELDAISTWSGKRISLAGTFVDFNDPYDTHVTNQLTLIWNRGYTPYVNIMTTHSAQYVASGSQDQSIRSWARAFAIYANDGQRMAFLAPFPEMNGGWVPYGLDAANYKTAFVRIQNIFAEEGVPENSVRWVFAPNKIGAKFENYYPGDDLVDVIGFSAYNRGAWENFTWQTPEDLFATGIERMQIMAPGKPIFISQTGTTSLTAAGNNPEAKNQWLRDLYAFVSTQPAVKAVIYFNLASSNSDYRIFSNGDFAYQGYADGVSYSTVGYVPPFDLIRMNLLVEP